MRAYIEQYIRNLRSFTDIPTGTFWVFLLPLRSPRESNLVISVRPQERVHNAAYRHRATKTVGPIETHTKYTLLSRIGWLLKSAAKKKKSDSAAKKE